MTLLGLAVALLLGSGLVALGLYRWQRLSSGVGALGAVVGCALGMVPALQVLCGETLPTVERAWSAPAGEIAVAVDPLSAFFLLPIFVLSGLAAVYGREYLLAYASRKSLAPPTFFFNLMVASMVGVVTARDGVLFMVAWELMTVASYVLISFDYEDAAAKRAGWVFLIAAHIAVMCLLLMFLALGRASGRFAFAGFVVTGTFTPVLVFALALVAFGIKAGLVPLHVWLPEAHAAAPSHISALMSGVLIKMGVYGLLRVLTFLPRVGWWGPTLLALGLSSALLGVSLALYQRDIKRALAYSSIENVGLVFAGLGIGLWGVHSGRGKLAALGLLGGMLHLWNHVLMKGLMFLSAGSVLHGAGTKDMEKLGGLMKRMPVTGALMLGGAIAISALPPLNGFVSEWLMYLGLVEGGIGGGTAGGGVGSTFMLLAVGLLAFIGALAVLCFVRIIGVVLLGEPRSHAAAHAHESSSWMTAPMRLLLLASIAVAVAPTQVLRLISPVAVQLGAPPDALAQATSSTRPLGWGALAVWGGVGLMTIVLLQLLRQRAEEREPTWGCGYLAPTARMQYTGRSFTEVIAERLLPPVLAARVVVEPPQGIFPTSGALSADSSDPFTRGVYEPFLDRWARRFSELRWLQQGVLHVYILYILAVVVIALAWMTARAWWGA
jgi:formate hydrogenlyase subunit 3/multisubunit Na+/H+ antiporter MnhD subunit